MGRKVETNAQNSEYNPNERPSSARIEKIMEDTDPDRITPEIKSGLRENLRPSERESPVITPEITDDIEKKKRAAREKVHRTDPDEREW